MSSQRHIRKEANMYATMLVYACVVLALTGCSPGKMFLLAPQVQRRPIEELFHEAVSQSLPEQNLGIQDAPFVNHRPSAFHETIQFDDEGLPPVPPAPIDFPEKTSPIPPAPGLGKTKSKLQTPSLPVQPLTLNTSLRSTGGARKATHPASIQQVAATADNSGLLKISTKVNRESKKQTNPKSKRVTQVQGTAPAPLPGMKLVNEYFEETDVRQAIQAMAAQVGVSVILDDQVSGVISIILDNEPFEQALQKTLLPLGFIYKKQSDGSFLVGVSDPNSPLFPLLAERHRFEPLHGDSEELVKTLPDRLLPFVRVVENRNQVMIEAPTAFAESIIQQLKEADEPVPQVMLEAIICVVSPDTGFRFGLDWAHAVELNGETAVDLGLRGLTFSGGVSPIGLKNMFSNFAFTSAFVQLLAQEGYLSIRASPRIMAISGQRAEISIVRQTFFSTQPITSDLIYRQDIQEVEAGIDLVIVPTIRGNNVHVQIERAEVSEDIRSQTTDRRLNLNPFPIINRRRVTTNVTVEDGKTIVIGGLVAKQSVDRISRIPGLSALPGVGGLFERIERQDQESEVVIFISPKVIRHTDTQAPLACPPQVLDFSNE